MIVRRINLQDNSYCFSYHLVCLKACFRNKIHQEKMGDA
jgi:hypothetical protein